MTARAVLFDLDGTLIDTPALIQECFASVCGARGVAIDTSFVKTLIGKPLDVIFPLLLPRSDDKAVRDAIGEFRGIFASKSLPRARSMVFPGVDELLLLLCAQDIKLAVVTSKITITARELLEASGLSTHFSTIIGHDLAAAGKPSPDLALIALQQLGVTARDAVVVGDSVDDIGMAVAAGITPVGVTWGVSSANDLARAGAVDVANNITALTRSIQYRLTQEAARP